MTNLKNTYSLQAFPTEKTFKEFKPVRGLRFTCPIELKPGESAALDETMTGRILDPTSWTGSCVEPDVTPVFELIARQFGYELPLLLDGKGETGKPDDAWTVYADEGKAPMLVRWTMGDAQFLLTIAMHTWSPTEMHLLVLADEKALRHIDVIGETFRQLELPAPERREATVASGNVLQRVAEVADSGDIRFTVRCAMHLDPTQPLNEAQKANLRELRNSAQIFVSEAGETSGRPFGLEIGETQIKIRKDRSMTMFYKADERISWEFLRIIHRWSIADVVADMDQAFANHFTTRRRLKEGVSPADLRPARTATIDLELAERRALLDLLIQEIRGSESANSFEGRLNGRLHDTFGRRTPSLGHEFTSCPESELRGTGPNLQVSGGDVIRTSDLLYLLMDAFCRLPDQYFAGHGRRPKVRINAQLKAPVLAEQYRETHPACVQFADITNPFSAVHHGLPVRVDKSVMVWRSGYDREALAADFFYAPDTLDLHIANLYRVKVPKS